MPKPMERVTHEEIRKAYFLLTFGYLCVGVNLAVNDLAILLPTFLGYFLIYRGLCSLERLTVCARIGSHFAMPLAILFLPLVIHFDNSSGFWRDFDTWTFWPGVVMRQILMVLTAIVIWHTAPKRLRESLKTAIPVFFVSMILALVGWRLLGSEDNALKVASFLVYEIPAFYLAAMTAIVAKAGRWTD